MRELFPCDNEAWQALDQGLDEEDSEILEFTPEELAVATSRIRPKKAPGPDCIIGDIALACYRADPERLLRLYNKCLREGTFPACWKVGKLVLIPKPNSTKKRPLTLLSVLGKMYEALINERLKKCMKERAVLSDNQFGFRQGKSTSDALRKLKRRMRMAIARRKYCVVVSFDIRNAFNTIKWRGIMEALRRAGVPRYLRTILKEYGTGRELLFEGVGGIALTYQVNRGVPQGSVLGPTLWIIAFNKVLETGNPNGEVVGFADDTLLTVVSKCPLEVERVANAEVERLRCIVEALGCTFAPEKTQVIVTGPNKRARENVKITVAGTVIEHARSIKYLGVIVDDRLKFHAHVTQATEKASNVCRKLNGILKNNSGPTDKKRRMYTAVVQQVLLYGAPIWAERLTEKQRDQLNKAQRLAHLRQVQGYASTGKWPACVLSCNQPADLLAEEALRIEDRIKEREQPVPQIDRKNIKLYERSITIERWNSRWQEYECWLRKLCGNVEDVNRENIRNTFYTTQLLGGKGVFNSYRKLIGKAQADSCWYCPGEVDTPEHTLFHCPRWKSERDNAKEVIQDFNCHEEFLKNITVTKEAWKTFEKFAKQVMKEKEEEERRREQRHREEAAAAARHRQRCIIM